MEHRVRWVTSLLGALVGFAIVLLIDGVRAPPAPQWQDEAGPRRGQFSIVSRAESWNLARSVLALHAAPDFPALDSPYTWSVVAPLPAGGWLAALLARAGLTHSVLEAEATQPAWTVINLETDATLPGDGVILEFGGVSADSASVCARLALQPYENVADRSWRPVRVVLPRGARQVRVRALTGEPGSTAHCDHVWVHIVRIASYLGPVPVRGLQVAVNGIVLALLGAWSARYVPGAWRVSTRVLRAAAHVTQPVEIWLRACAHRVRPIPVICLAAWLFFYVPRVWQLGFYADDWGCIVFWSHESIEARFLLWFTLIPPRPIAALFMPTLSIVLGGSPALWQGALALASLTISLQLHGVLRELRTRPNSDYSPSADLAAASWLLLPWSLPTTVWAAALPGLLSVSLFLAAARVLVTAGQAWRRWLVAAALYLLSCLSYEAFYLGFGCLLTLWLAARLGHRPRRETLWLLLRGAVLFTLVQLVAAAYSRLWAYLTPTVAKQFNPDYLMTTWRSLRGLPALCLASFGGAEQAIAWLCVGLGALGLVGVAAALARRRFQAVLATTLLAIGAGSGIAASVGVYALASYAVTTHGDMGRTMLAINVYLALLVFAALRCVRMAGFALPTLPSYALTGGLLVLAGLALRTDQDRWARGWQLITITARGAPVDALSRLPEDAKVVYVGPTEVDGLAVVGSVELSAAVFHYHPSARIRSTATRDAAAAHGWVCLTTRERIRTIYAKFAGHIVRWDGATFTQELPGHWRFAHDCSRLFLWNGADGRITPLNPPVTLGLGSTAELQESGGPTDAPDKR